MKLKLCLCIFFFLSVYIVESQTQYKNRLAGKVLGSQCDGIVYLFKDSTYYTYTYSRLGLLYSFGSYKYISRDTVQLKSKYSINSINSNQEIKEYKSDSVVNSLKIENKNPCSSNQIISVYLYKENEELYAWENVKFNKYLELSTDSLIKFDNIVIRLNKKYRIDYNLKDIQNNVVELHYVFPNDNYEIEDLIIIHKKNRFYVNDFRYYFEIFVRQKMLKHFIENFPEPCYLNNY